MTKLLINLIKDLITGSSEVLDPLLKSMTGIVFHAEDHMLKNVIDISLVFKIFYAYAIYIIILKFLKKGFETYILWQDGDPDYDPFNYILNFAKAIIIAIIFGTVYDWMVNVVNGTIDSIFFTLNNSKIDNLNIVQTILNFIKNNLFYGTAALISIVCYGILYFQFLIRGIQILILRLGVPIACAGLIDSNKGSYAPYIQKFVMNAFTVIVQVVCVKVSFHLLHNGQLIYGIAVCVVAIKTPKFLSEFLIQSGSGIGGVTNTVIQSANIFRLMKK